MRFFCREHPNGPVCVGIDWILTCIYHEMTIAAPPFPPEPKLRIRGSITNGRSSVGSKQYAAATRSIEPSNKQQSTVFRGDVFAVVPSKAAPDTLCFGLEAMESTILGHGRLLLTKSLLLAIRKDAKAAENPASDRNYYVVSSRWLQLDCATSFPLLAELRKLGIAAVPVSPVWVAACIENNYQYDPEESRTLFQPQTWPIRLLNNPIPSSAGKNGSSKPTAKFLFSVTGFLDSTRYAITSALTQIGAEYTDNLSRKNTHLICKEAKGAKYNKAIEWGTIHAVSIEWLYHVIKEGYEEGCEYRFSSDGVKKEPMMVRKKFGAKTGKTDKVRSSLDNGFTVGKGYKVGDGRLVGRNASSSTNRIISVRKSDASEIAVESKNNADVNGSRADERHMADNSLSKGHRGKRDPPQASPTKRDNPTSQSLLKTNDDDDDDGANNPSKRLQFALQALEGPPVGAINGSGSGSMSTNSRSGRMSSPQRRGKRERSPSKTSQERNSASLLSQQSEDENTQTETQFTIGTIGTIRADADVGGFNDRRRRLNSGDDDMEEVPLSQAEEAEDNGESQVVWYAHTRG